MSYDDARGMFSIGNWQARMVPMGRARRQKGLNLQQANEPVGGSFENPKARHTANWSRPAGVWAEAGRGR